jgi:hypothetical protein
VSDSSPLLDRAGIEDAFRRLGKRLARRGVVADLYVFGGAAMALACDSRRSTRDVGALFKPHGVVHEEGLAVAAELGLPRWWLNEQASSYVAPAGIRRHRVFDHPGLRVFAASPEHLLAMKVFAARPRAVYDLDASAGGYTVSAQPDPPHARPQNRPTASAAQQGYRRSHGRSWP